MLEIDACRELICVEFDPSCALGLSMQTDLVQDPTGRVLVTNVIPGSAADRMGVQPGSALESVSGLPAATLSQSEVLDLVVTSKEAAKAVGGVISLTFLLPVPTTDTPRGSKPDKPLPSWPPRPPGPAGSQR